MTKYTITKANLKLLASHDDNIRYFVEDREGNDYGNYSTKAEAEQRVIELTTQ